MNLNRVAILAPGLLGGSIALALRERQPHLRLSIFARKKSTLDEIQSQNLKADFFTDPTQAVQEADLTLFCMTLGAMPEMAQKVRPFLKKGSVVSDVGSVKGSIDTSMRAALGNEIHWIGSHPMAGGEKSGFSAAQSDLFEGATTILTPTSESHPSALQLLSEFWKSLGSRIVLCTPQEHDQRVAQISHLTHLTASALVRAASPESLEVRGPGFRDTTRVAAGSPSMWSEIILQNSVAVQNSLSLLQNELHQLQEILKNSDSTALQEWLQKASSLRSSLSFPPPKEEKK